MLKHYLKLTIRNLWKQKGFSLTNISGLALGMAACLLLLDYVSFELSFDQFHEKGDRIYRVINERFQDGQQVQKGTITYPTVGSAMAQDFPEIEANARVFYSGNNLIRREGEIRRLEQTLFVDPAFFQLFSFPLLAGESDSLLARTNQVVVTRQLADAFLGVEQERYETALGRSFHIGTWEEPFTVVGVCEAPPPNSLLHFDLLVSYPSAVRYWGEGVDQSWQWSDFYHYLLLKPEADPAGLEAKFPAFSDRHFRGQEVSGSEEHFYLQPLSEAHLYSTDLEYEIGRTVNGRVIWSLLIIGFFILIIAWINYVNLSSVRAIERSREVGIRLVAGARRGQLMRQFMLEALVINMISFLLALQLAHLFRPWLGSALGTDTQLTSLWRNYGAQTGLLLGMGLLMVAGVGLSGFYPAWLLSAQRTAGVLRGVFRRSASGTWIRKSLVIFQFAASVALVAGTLTVYRQLSYMSRQDLGVNIDQVMVLNSPELTQWDSTFIDRMNAMKEALRAIPGVVSATASSRVPGQGTGRIFNLRQPGDPTASYMANFIEVDHSFAETYDLSPLAGRDLRREDHNLDMGRIHNVVINRSTAEMLGYARAENAVGAELRFWDRNWTVVGILPDFHQRSLHHAIEPLVFLPFYSPHQLVSVKVKAEDVTGALDRIRSTYAGFFPGNTFEYEFLDERFGLQYEAERRFSRVLLFFTGLAIFIACLGLFGLAAYSAFLRTKEIGVRKVLGASAGQLVLLLSKDFLRLVAVATLAGLPLAWYGLRLWLADFAYRSPIPWWVPVGAAVLALLIAFLTVSYQALRAARANPVEALRSE